MIIKNITIENFRSYYGRTSIDIGSGLTLLIGSNGDGKTTFFDALEWLFDTAGSLPKIDTKFISKKKISNMDPSDRAKLCVSMTYENNASERIIQKSFSFTKTLSGEISTSNFLFELFIQKDGEREVFDGDVAQRMFNADFAPSVRKYSLFKGENNLNIFKNDEAMSYLVETFSQIKDFDPYLEFMNYAKEKSQKATDNAMSSDRRNAKQAASLRSNIMVLEREIGNLQADLQNNLNEVTNFQTLLDDLERNKEASENLVNLNRRLETLKLKKEEYQKQLKENYTYRLLDDMWILMGFQPIAEEFREKVAKLDKEQRQIQSNYDREQGAKAFAQQLQRELCHGHVPLALNIPDENTMKEMLDDEVCKVCGRPAPKGSEAYEFMKNRLDAFLDSQKEEEEPEEKPIFPYHFIKELNDKYSILHNNKRQLSELSHYIDNAIQKNIELHSQIDRVSANINSEEERKKQLLAQTEGLTEEQLVSAYNSISEWWNGRRDAEQRSANIKATLKIRQEKLDAYQEEYSKISEASSAAMFGRSSRAIRHIADAFLNSKVKNKHEFLMQLEEVANEYLKLLNVNDFRGYTRIKEKANMSAEIVLEDVDGSRIYNPNTALETTMYMSLLFAVSKLSTIKHENDYPLIFDAPTSSFTSTKENDFFNVISKVNKQTIIATKSFLIENKPGEGPILDIEKIRKFDGKKYRLAKKKPYDDKNLSTIESTVLEIL